MSDYARRFSVQGKRALVTGGSRGIGAENRDRARRCRGQMSASWAEMQKDSKMVRVRFEDFAFQSGSLCRVQRAKSPGEKGEISGLVCLNDCVTWWDKRNRPSQVPGHSRLAKGEAHNAERSGFEPEMPVSRHTGLAIRRFRPLSHLSGVNFGEVSGKPRLRGEYSRKTTQIQGQPIAARATEGAA